MLGFLNPKALAVDIGAVDIGQAFPPAQKGFTSVGFLVNVLLPNILTLAGIIAFIAVVFAGFKMIIDAGHAEGEKLAKDKAAFTGALIGLIIIFGAYWILSYLGIIVGFNFLNPVISP